MRAILFLGAAALAASVMASDPRACDPSVRRFADGWGRENAIVGTTDREIPVYRTGETMSFTFRLRGFRGLSAGIVQSPVNPVPFGQVSSLSFGSVSESE